MAIQDIIAQFAFDGALQAVREFGSGHINTTYLAQFDSGKAYVLQQINRFVFQDADALMDNVFAVTDYLRERIAAEGGDPDRETLRFIRTKDGKKYYETPDGHAYRAYLFVKDSVCYDKAATPALFQKSGEAFGIFQQRLRDFPAATLTETIPHFHDTPWRFEHEFLPALHRAAEAQRKSCQEEITWLLSQRHQTDSLTKLLALGRLPLRVTHNDTKLNNVLFDKTTDQPLAVIDLDTVMPGSALYDFGDAIRFGANPADEDEQDLGKVSLDLDYFAAYAEGYLRRAGDALTDDEKAHLAIAPFVLTLELALRFLTDYLNGNVYFKTAYPAHNLMRARTQIKLAQDMAAKQNAMQAIIASLS
ncbi:MAG: aminoglycoside phosphotransferase family protein [Eubacterium sp.]|nr:aminoglycoside phosphotransferase family protein [Eubacterium sp.]